MNRRDLRDLLQRAAAVIEGFLAADVWQGDISPEEAQQLVDELLAAVVEAKHD